MNDLRKTKAQLIAELAALRQRVAELEVQAVGPEPPADQARHRLVAELMSDYVYSGVAYPNGVARTEWVSGAFEGILGYTLAEVQSLPGGFCALVVPEDLAAIAAQQPRLFAGEALTVEYRVRHRSGDIRWLRDSMQPVEALHDRAGVRLIGAVQDVTARKQVEAALRESEERFRTVADFTHDWEYWLGPDRQIIYMSPSCEQITGYRVAEFEAQAALLETIVHPDDHALFQRHLAHEFASEAVDSVDFRIVTRQGEVRWLNHICRSVYDSAGQWSGRRASTRDITERTLAEAAVRASEECLRTFFQHSPIGLAIVDRDFRFLAINETLAAFNDLPVAAHLGQRLATIKPQAAQTLEPIYKQILATGQPAMNVRTTKQTDLESVVRHFVSTYFPILDAQNAISALGMAVTDITEHRQIEEQLARSEAKFRAFIEQSSEGVVITDEQGRIIEWNRTLEQMSGLPRTAVLGQNLWDIQTRLTSPTDTSAALVEQLKFTVLGALQTGQAAFFGRSFEANIQTPAGECKSILQLSFPIQTEAGYRIGAVVRDITEYKRTDAARRESEEKYRLLIDTANEGVWAMDRAHCTTYVNVAMATMLGYTPDEMLGRPVEDFFFEEDLPIHNQRMQHRHAGQDEVYERRFRRRDGSSLWTLVSARATKDVAGEFNGSFAMFTDITKRKRAEDLARESQAQAKAILDAIPDLMFRFDRQGVFLSYKADITQLYNQSVPTLVGLRNRDISPPEFADLIEQQIAVTLDTGTLQTFEYQLDIPQQGARNYEARIVPSGPDEVMAIVRDITERKQVELALQDSREKYRSLLESLDSVVAVIDAAGCFLYMNEVAARQLGGTPDQFIGRTMAELFPEPYASQQLADIQDVIHTDRPVVNQTESYVHGQSLWYRNSLQPIHDEAGRPVQVLLNTTDITAIIQAQHQLEEINRMLEERVAQRTQELAAANERLTELDRLKSKFVSDVSHELRTPVTSLSVYIDLLEHGKPEKREHYVKQLQIQMTRLHKLIDDILDLSRLERDRDEGGRSLVDLNSIAEHVTAMERGTAEAAGLTLTCEVADHLPPIVARADQLTRAITNLVSNAIKYTAAGSVRVQTRLDAQRVCLEVTDTGRGIPADELPHLFARFYRGKGVAQSSIPGTGLGLSIVKEIIESHGGTVEVESVMGQGSTFRVWLPAAEAEPPRSEP